jgi:ribonucleoside-diphosphate reductase alpha chain
VSPREHLDVLACAQALVDSAVSKTINLPKDIAWEDFKNVYMRAWEQGCKGCTTYRPGKRGAVLTSMDEEAPVAACKLDSSTGRMECE